MFSELARKERAGLVRVSAGLRSRWQRAEGFLEVRRQPFSCGSFWLAKGTVGDRSEGPPPLWGQEEGADNDTAIEWEVSVVGVCLPACLPLCCSEGGRGWACSCLGRAAPGSCVGQSSSLVTDSPLRSPLASAVCMGPWAASPGQEDCGSILLQVELPALWEVFRAGPGWGEPQRGAVSSGWVRAGQCHIQGSDGRGGRAGAAGLRCHLVLGSSL